MDTWRKSTRPGQQSWRTCKGGQKTDGWFSFVSEKHTALRSGAFKEKFLIFNNYKFSSDLLGSAAAIFISLSLLPLWTQFHREVIKLVVSSPNRCECRSPFGAQLTDGISHGLSHHHIFTLGVKYSTIWILAFCFQSHNTDLNLIILFLCEIFQLSCLSPLQKSP